MLCCFAHVVSVVDRGVFFGAGSDPVFAVLALRRHSGSRWPPVPQRAVPPHPSFDLTRYLLPAPTGARRYRGALLPPAPAVDRPCGAIIGGGEVGPVGGVDHDVLQVGFVKKWVNVFFLPHPTIVDHVFWRNDPLPGSTPPVTPAEASTRPPREGHGAGAIHHYANAAMCARKKVWC